MMNLGLLFKTALATTGVSPILSIALGALSGSENKTVQTAHTALAAVKKGMDNDGISKEQQIIFLKNATDQLAIECETNVALSQSVNASMSAESKSLSRMQRIWRPVFGLIISLCFGATIIATLVLTFTNPDKASALINAIGNLMPLWVSAFGVLGVYTHGRTKEKLKGKPNGI